MRFFFYICFGAYIYFMTKKIGVTTTIYAQAVNLWFILISIQSSKSFGKKTLCRPSFGPRFKKIPRPKTFAHISNILQFIAAEPNMTWPSNSWTSTTNYMCAWAKSQEWTSEPWIEAFELGAEPYTKLLMMTVHCVSAELNLIMPDSTPTCATGHPHAHNVNYNRKCTICSCTASTFAIFCPLVVVHQQTIDRHLK